MKKGVASAEEVIGRDLNRLINSAEGVGLVKSLQRLYFQALANIEEPGLNQEAVFQRYQYIQAVNTLLAQMGDNILLSSGEMKKTMARKDVSDALRTPAFVSV